MASLLLSLIAATQLCLADSFESAFQRLNSQSEVSGSFKQTQKLSSLDTSLKSSGNFKLTKKKLSWDQSHPFKMSIYFDDSKISTRVESGPTKEIKKTDNPVFFGFASIFTTLFKGEKEQLEQHFITKKVIANQSWTLTMTPKDKSLSKAIASIELSGKQNMESIRVQQTSGDEVDIKLTFND